MAAKQEFESRFAKHKDELEWLFMELYHDREALHTLEAEMEQAWNARTAELKALDKARTADPEWYKRGNMFGMTMYTDLFAGNLKELAKTVTNRPTVISEKKFGSSWYMPAGDSYVAHLYNDAGADYIFKDLPGAGSTPLAFETVLDKAIHANMWLIKYNQTNDMTYKDLRTEYTPYENFDAFKNRRIYTCNTGIVPYYEEFPIHPDYLLKDLVWVFHPELLPGYTPRYYRKME